MQNKLIAFFIFILLAAVPAYSFQAVDTDPEFQPSQAELLDFAVQKGEVPANRDEAYFYKKVAEEKDTLSAWVGFSQEDKIAILKVLIETFGKEGAVVKRSPVYYSREIDKILYNGLKSGTFREMKGIGMIFKTIAILDGDFDNGEDPKVLLETWAPSEAIEAFKKNNPERYERVFGEQKK